MISPSRRAATSLVLAVALLAGAAPAANAAPGKGGTGTSTCNPRKAACTVDTTAPTVAIQTPVGGEQVRGSVAVAGIAADDTRLGRVEVRVDDGPWILATGTTTWSTAVDAPAAPGAGIRLTARATDASGNVATTSVDVVVAGDPAEEPAPPADQTPAPAPTQDWVVADPRAAHALLPLGRTRMAQWGELTGVLYTEQFTNRRAIALRDATSGEIAYVDLPTESLAGWVAAATVLTSAQDLWVFGGTGPMYVRHYRLQGSPLPTTATLVEQRVLGDSDSRPGDMTALASGGIVLSWLQHGATGPQGQHVSHRSPDGRWQDLPALTFMPTKSSDQVLGQHPADGSIWLFSNPDAWGAIGAAHLTETSSGLRVDWTDSTFVSTTRHGLSGPDPENPDLALAVDPTRRTMSLAYQSADRQRFTNATASAIGSRIAVASVATDGALTFLTTPVWAERVSDVGLVTDDGEVVVAHRPLDPDTLAARDVQTIRHRAGTWEAAVSIGTAAGADPTTYATARPEVATHLSDGLIHVRTV